MADVENKDINEMKFTLTLVLNASFSIWETKPNPPENSNNNSNAAVAALCLLGLSSLGLNLCIVTVICSSYSLKRVSLNLCTLSIGVACLLDAAFNIPVSVFFAKSVDESIGPKTCTLNASIHILVSLVIAWEIVVLCTNRWMAFTKGGQPQFSVNKQIVATIAVWASALMILMPVASGAIKSRASHSRLSCSALKKGNFYFVIVVFSIFMVLIISSFLVLMATLCRRIRDKRAFNFHQNEMTYTERFFEESNLKNEIKHTKFVCLVYILFVCLELPFSITQFELPIESSSIGQTKLLETNRTINFTYSNYPIRPRMDSCFVWLKYVFDFLFPSVVLMAKGDVYRKCQSLFLGWRTKGAQSTPEVDNARSTEVPLTEDAVEPVGFRRHRRRSTLTYLKDSLSLTPTADKSLFQFWNVATAAREPFDKREGLSKRACLNRTGSLIDFSHMRKDISPTEIYQDLGEDEIYSAETVIFEKSPKAVREVAVQTAGEAGMSRLEMEVAEDITQNNESFEEVSVKKPRRKLFPSYAPKNWALRNALFQKKEKLNKYRKFCNTLPRFEETAIQDKNNVAEEGLVSALRGKSTSTCGVLPRGTVELLDAIVDNRDIVSL